ncbi:MAG: hypothetical protein AAB505_01050 [Patescibacteria group bacterium]
MKTTKHKLGFGLLEFLVTLGIFVIIIVVLTSFQTNIFSQNNLLNNSLVADSEMRTAMKRLIAELRGAAQSDTGAYQLAVASGSTMTFYSDIDSDGLHEQLRYFVDGTTLKRGVIKPTGSPLAYVSGNEQVTSLIKNLANPTQVFSYYDDNYTGSESALVAPIDIPNVRLAKITFTVDADPTRPPAPLTLTSQVAIRSLKY